MYWQGHNPPPPSGGPLARPDPSVAERHLPALRGVTPLGEPLNGYLGQAGRSLGLRFAQPALRARPLCHFAASPHTVGSHPLHKGAFKEAMRKGGELK